MDWWYPKNLPVHRGCSKRWYFIFNGAECADPLPIDGIALAGYVKSRNPRSVIPRDTHKGEVYVGFWVVDCTDSGKLHGGGADAYT